MAKYPDNYEVERAKCDAGLAYLASALEPIGPIEAEDVRVLRELVDEWTDRGTSGEYRLGCILDRLLDQFEARRD